MLEGPGCQQNPVLIGCIGEYAIGVKALDGQPVCTGVRLGAFGDLPAECAFALCEADHGMRCLLPQAGYKWPEIVGCRSENRHDVPGPGGLVA